MTTTADAKLQQLVDHHDITDLVYRLGVALDEGRFDEMRSLFIEQATARTPGGTAEGRAALITQASRNHTPDRRIQHVTTNVLVDVDGDRANVRANLVVNFGSVIGTDESALAPPVQFTLGEVYRFAAVRTPTGWRFSSVETSPVWMTGSRPLPRSAQLLQADPRLVDVDRRGGAVGGGRGDVVRVGRWSAHVAHRPYQRVRGRAPAGVDRAGDGRARRAAGALR